MVGACSRRFKGPPGGREGSCTVTDVYAVEESPSGPEPEMMLWNDRTDVYL